MKTNRVHSLIQFRVFHVFIWIAVIQLKSLVFDLSRFVCCMQTGFSMRIFISIEIFLRFIFIHFDILSSGRNWRLYLYYEWKQDDYKSYINGFHIAQKQNTVCGSYIIPFILLIATDVNVSLHTVNATHARVGQKLEKKSSTCDANMQWGKNGESLKSCIWDMQRRTSPFFPMHFAAMGMYMMKLQTRKHL